VFSVASQNTNDTVEMKRWTSPGGQERSERGKRSKGNPEKMHGRIKGRGIIRYGRAEGRN
jgi:hypothetical protein